MGQTISEAKIIELNTLYLEIGTYSGVSRAMGGSPSPTTVKKYIIPGFVPPQKIVQTPYNAEVRRALGDTERFSCQADFEDVWEDLAPNELKELNEFRKEILV